MITDGIHGEILPELKRGLRLPEYIEKLDDDVIRASIDYNGLLRYLHKEYGPNGCRQEPSDVDKSLIQICLTNKNISGIVSRDGDLYNLWAELDINDRERFSIKAPHQIF